MMVSVCIATHNGEKYLLDQIDSILNQLNENDEVIVCDDCSSDNTVKILNSFSDSRLRIYCNSSRLGHVQNFAKAISYAKGAIVFLSDQDDVWLPGRYPLMIKHLHQNPLVNMVASNFALIDEHGNAIGRFNKLVPGIGKRWPRILTIFLGQMPYYGCTFAFKRELIPSILPIPPRIESHDIWIALLANFLGAVENLDAETLCRRIHASNLTSKTRRPLLLILKSRGIFLYEFFKRSLKFSYHKK